MVKKMKLGELLIQSGEITEEQLKDSLSKQENNNNKIGEQLLVDGYVEEEVLLSALSSQLDRPFVDLENTFIDKSLFENLDKELMQKKIFIPIRREEHKIIVALADPLDMYLIEDLEVFLDSSIEVRISTNRAIQKKIEEAYTKKEIIEKIPEIDVEVDKDLDKMEKIRRRRNAILDSDPIVKLVDAILKSGLDDGASDIHIEPFDNMIKVRNRVDGDLRKKQEISKEKLSAITTRIKIIGNMNISEKRKPQDGRVEETIDGKAIDLRISILPTVYGEKTVIRLLDRDSLITDLNKLGFTKNNIKILKRMLKAPQGMILVTGPTGSGKTTTLYSLLKTLNKEKSNLITIEDPVEYRLEGINQVQVNNKAGLSFASGLRSILRQDPDIVMVGEIRDKETSEIALRASITGHLVLSTLHTNDTASTISRLLDIGAKSYVLSSSLVGIIAQRLVPKLCSCKKETKATKEDVEFLNTIKEGDIIMKPNGCPKCDNTGYSGRIAIHEMMVIDKDIRGLINKEASSDVIKNKSVESGMTTLQSEGETLVKEGLTSAEEVLKVAYTL